MASTPLIKFEVCAYKKDDVSEEDFINWATKIYPVRAVPLIKKHGVVKFTQTVQPSSFREPFRHMLKAQGRSEWSVPDYDLTITYWLPSLDAMKSLTSDPEWAELEQEALTKTNMTIGHFVIGHEIVHFENNVVGTDA